MKMIKLSGELAQNVLELSPDATLVVDREGTIVFANAQVERTFGYAPHELAGQSVDMLLPTRFRPNHAAHRTVQPAADGLHRERHPFAADCRKEVRHGPRGLAFARLARRRFQGFARGRATATVARCSASRHCRAAKGALS